MDMDKGREDVAMNVESQILMSRYAIPAMKDTAGGGAIVNISSVSALRPKGNALIYSVTKGANIALTQAMAVDHAKDGIRVNCVVIGPVYTPTVYERGMSEERKPSGSKHSGEEWRVVVGAAPCALWRAICMRVAIRMRTSSFCRKCR